MRRWCELLIGAVVLAVLLQTFAVLGLFAPLRVSAGSMAPHLWGPHWEVKCPDCRARYRVGADAPPQAGRTVCPDCQGTVVIESAPRRDGQRLYVDRATLQFRRPLRWEPIVFLCPLDARILCIKRVVGLPGERIELEGGDVFVNGELQRKSLTEQLALRVLVHRERGTASRWNATALPSHWKRSESTWQYTNSPTAGRPLEDWLAFHAPGDDPLDDHQVYNSGVRSIRNSVADLMLSFHLVSRGGGRLAVHCGPLVSGAEQRAGLVVELSPSQRDVRIRESLPPPLTRAASSSANQASRTTRMHVVISLFDQQILVALDGREMARKDLAAPPVASSRPFAIATMDLHAELADLTIWRDIVYTVRPGGRVSEPSESRTWRLGADEYFVLGDNPTISDDSRTWRNGPGLPADLIVGRPIGID